MRSNARATGETFDPGLDIVVALTGTGAGTPRQMAHRPLEVSWASFHSARDHGERGAAVMPIRSRARALTSLAGVCAIVIGIVAGCGTAGPAATSTVSPSPLATASPSQSATAATTASGPTSLMDSPEGGDLPAGAYYLDLPAYPARIDFEVPAGWWHFWPGATRQASDAHAILVNSLETGAANDQPGAWRSRSLVRCRWIPVTLRPDHGSIRDAVS